MPTVPTYQDSVRPVALSPEFTELNTRQYSADSFGGGVARSLQGVAQGVSAIGQAFAEQELQDDTHAAKDAENQYAEWTRNAMYGDNGFMTLQGINAVNGRKVFEEQAEQKRVELMGGLNERAKLIYDDTTKARQQSTFNGAIQHAASERKTWWNETSDARIEGFAQDAVAAGTDHGKANAMMQAGINELREQSNLNGWSPEVFDAKKQRLVSGVTKQIVLDLAQNDPIAADKYMRDAGGRLDPATRRQLENGLKRPLLAAKANRNLADITGGLSAPTYDDEGNMTFEPEATGLSDGARVAKYRGGAEIDRRDVRGLVRGSQSFQQVAGSLMGMNEASNSSALSHFIKNAAGINVNPATTPWCAGFANAVLGAQGIKGTGSLSARSFLNFGMATDNPKLGDIVVFDRGGNGKGHVGFFQGYDANGRILTLGGNQGKNGSVSISAQGPEKLLGFRTAGTVDGKTMHLPNYNPNNLGQMQAKLDAITDPEERAATAKALNNYMTSQKKLVDAQRQQVEDWVGKQVINDPTFDPMMLPMNVQDTLGPSGMETLMSYQDKVRAHGKPITNDKTLADLSDAFATDPESFATVDLWQHRAELSDSDWDKVQGWKRTAQQDIRKAREQGSDLNAAFSQAKEQLTAIGMLKAPSKMGDEDNKKVARFQNALAEELENFRAQSNGKKPNQVETQNIINRMLLPIVIKTPGLMWGTNSQQGLIFESRTMAENATIMPTVGIEDIPFNVRTRARQNIEEEKHGAATEEEIIQWYVEFLASRR